VVTALPQWAYEPYYWDDDQCRLFGLDREKFPPFVKMGERIGQVSPAAARGAGGFLPAGTPIIAGGPDFITALLGVAAQKRGDVCDRAGTSEGINVCTPEKPDLSGPAGGPRGGLDGLRALPHAKEGWWNLGALIASSGRLFEWYRTLTGQADRDYGDHLAELIPGSPEEGGRGFFFPPSQAAGSAGTAPGGARSPGFLSYTGEGPLALPDKTTLGRSVLEAMAFAVRTAAEVLESRGFPVRHLRVSGGQGKNRRWNQLKADITGRSLMVGEIPDGELAGNAVLAAATLGNTGGHTAAAIEEAAAGMIRFRDVYEPCGKTAAFWDERFERYRELAGLLAGHQADSSAGGELRS
jgi:sugar (pentulose or hexulose) kinase